MTDKSPSDRLRGRILDVIQACESLIDMVKTGLLPAPDAPRTLHLVVIQLSTAKTAFESLHLVLESSNLDQEDLKAIDGQGGAIESSKNALAELRTLLAPERRVLRGRKRQRTEAASLGERWASIATRVSELLSDITLQSGRVVVSVVGQESHPHPPAQLSALARQGKTSKDGETVTGSQELCSDCQRLDLDGWEHPNPSRIAKLRPQKAGDHSCRLCRFAQDLAIFRNHFVPDCGVDFAFALSSVSLSQLFKVKTAELRKAYAFSTWSAARTTKAMGEDNQGRLHATIFSSSGIFRNVQKGLDYGIVREWLDFCGHNHSRTCPKRSPPNLPGFRVIDCRRRKIRLWADISSSAYVTLSYVWGIGASVPPLEGGALPSRLPATIEDSLAVTLKLGYRYLWIDRYCIPQDNPDQKMAQIQNMKSIYGQSELTLIAAAGDGPEHGLPGVGSTPRTSYPTLSIRGHDFFPLINNIVHEIDQSTWNQRGWTYQEGILCRARLVFTDTQSYFQCSGMNCLENIALPLQHVQVSKQQMVLNRSNHRIRTSLYPKYFSLGKHPDQLEDYLEKVNEYKSRSLSYQSDALDAFAGVLELLKSGKMPVDHLLGIPLFHRWYYQPTKQLLAGLLWNFSWSAAGSEEILPVSGGNALAGDCEVAPERRREFPSWAWLGWLTPKQLKIEYHPLMNNPVYQAWYRPRNWRDTPITSPHYSLVRTIEFGSVKRPLNWKEQHQKILRKFLSKKRMPFDMRLDGWVVNLEFPKTAFDLDEDTAWGITCGPFSLSRSDLALIAVNANRGNGGIIMDGDRAVITCILLLCYDANSVLGPKYERKFWGGLVLGPQENSEAFERLGTLTLWAEGLPAEVEGIWDFESACPGRKFGIPYTRRAIILK